MKSEFYELERKEKRFIVVTVIVWAIMAFTTLARATESRTNEKLPITVFGTNTLYVNVPADRQELIRKYLLLAQRYQEQRILREDILKDYASVVTNYRDTLNKMEALARKKDAANNVVSLGNIIAQDLGFELTYLRRIWGPFWAYGRIQTPVGGSAGIGFAW